MTSNIKKLDPVQGLVDYILDIKPYHTKVIEILTEYVYDEIVDVTVTEDLHIDVGMFFGDVPGDVPMSEQIQTVGGFGGHTTYGGFTSWPVIPPSVTHVNGPFVDAPLGYDIVNDTLTLSGDRTKQYAPGIDIIVDLHSYDVNFTEPPIETQQTTYTIIAAEYISYGQINGVAITPYTKLTVASLLDPATLAPGNNVAGVKLKPIPIDSVVGYSNATPVFYTNVPPEADPTPTPTIGSLSQTPDENPVLLQFSNSFVVLGDVSSGFPQGYQFLVAGGTTAGQYTTMYSYYDTINDLTYIRVSQTINTVGFVTGNIQEIFFGYAESGLSGSNIPVGLLAAEISERLVFSWNDGGSDVIDGYQFVIQESDAVSDFFAVNGDATDDIGLADTIQVIGSLTNDGVYTVTAPAPTFNGTTTDIYVAESVTTTQTGLATYRLRLGQSDQMYDGVGNNGVFDGGDGAGGTAYVVSDTITLSDGTVVTVTAVDVNGDVVSFGVTTPSDGPVVLGVALTQTSTTGTGAAFTLTPELANVLVRSRGWVETHT